MSIYLGKTTKRDCQYYYYMASKMYVEVVPPQLSGFICAFHIVTLGLTPMDTIYICYICPCDVRKE